MLWTLVEVTFEGDTGKNHYAVGTGNRGKAIRTVIENGIPEGLMAAVNNITATLKTEELTPDEGLPLLRANKSPRNRTQ